MIQYFDLTLHELEKSLKSFDLSVVIPVYNEEKNIEQVLSNWDKKLNELSINYCFVLVNDGSKDQSLDIIKKLNFPIYLLNKPNSGHGRSIRLGYDFAVHHIGSEFIFQIDSDGQCDPQFFPSFWEKRQENDFIIGVRTSRGDGLIRKLTSKISWLITSLLTSINLKDPNTPYRLFKLPVLKEALEQINESFDIHNIALTYVIFKKKHKIQTIEIDFPDRIGGENSINVLKVFQMGLNMLFDMYFLIKKLKK